MTPCRYLAGARLRVPRRSDVCHCDWAQKHHCLVRDVVPAVPSDALQRRTLKLPLVCLVCLRLLIRTESCWRLSPSQPSGDTRYVLQDSSLSLWSPCLPFNDISNSIYTCCSVCVTLQSELQRRNYRHHQNWLERFIAKTGNELQGNALLEAMLNGQVYSTDISAQWSLTACQLASRQCAYC